MGNFPSAQAALASPQSPPLQQALGWTPLNAREPRVMIDDIEAMVKSGVSRNEALNGCRTTQRECMAKAREQVRDDNERRRKQQAETRQRQRNQNRPQGNRNRNRNKRQTEEASPTARTGVQMRRDCRTDFRTCRQNVVEAYRRNN